MKSLRNHFSVIFPLIVLLFSLQFTLGLEKIVGDYEKKLIDDYSIIVVSVKDLDENVLKQDIKQFKSLEQVSTKKILERLKNDISAKNLSLLQVALPRFYSIKLRSFPNTKEMQHIKEQLKAYESVTKVETFAKTHDKIYRIFTIAQSMAYVFTAFTLIISLLLMLKQMRIWVLEHKERMDIMTLFGAPFWMKSAVLYRLAIIDSILATLIVVGIFFFLPDIPQILALAKEIDIVIPSIDIVKEGGTLLGISLFFALVSVSMVMMKVKRDHR